MSSNPQDRAGGAPVPSMLDLVRLSRRSLFPPGGVDLYRQIALLTDMSPGQEVLDVACGPGVALQYFVTEYGVHGSGVDYDPGMVEVGDARARRASLTERMHFQHATMDALPYRDEIFDVVVGELGLAAQCDPEAAVRELVRVTKPGGRVVLVQLVWKAPVEEERREVLASHLGAHPLMLVEWKRLLRETGVTGLHTEDWSDEETAFRPQIKKPFHDFSELFSVGEKIGILRRAWGRWGFRGVRIAVSREKEVHRVLTRERILGLDLVLGTRDPATVPSSDAGLQTAGEPAAAGAAGDTPAPPPAPDSTEVEAAGGGGEPPLAPSGETPHDAPPDSEAGPDPAEAVRKARPTPDAPEADEAAEVDGLPLFTTRDEAP